ncbi:protein AMBP-like isoform X2 [Gouania willdenowi]|uniref:protein AMBP-like isoform X2 n=1 Tax=Gouania willdenowi TaxID=441366 RepID=UPI001056384F|nr:protein AMBP-like isoform X2 [Gouania willdenowi]
MAAILPFLLVIGSTATLDVTPTQPGNVNLIQENFVLDQFMGRWYEVAVTSTCPHYMKRKKTNPVVVELMFEHSEGNLTMTSSTLSDGSCQHKLTTYNLTNTPGRFFHHVAQFAADVDSFVVQTNYTDHAVMFLKGVEKPLEITTFTAKLYSRTVHYRSALLDHFKFSLRRLGLNDNDVIVNQYKGQCDQSRHVTAEPQMFVSSKSDTNIHPVAHKEQSAVSAD